MFHQPSMVPSYHRYFLTKVSPNSQKVKNEYYLSGVSYTADHRKRQNNCDNKKKSYVVALMMFDCKKTIYHIKAYSKEVEDVDVWTKLTKKIICN